MSGQLGRVLGAQQRFCCDGIYKSTDGGENWNNVGLKDSEHIAKILVDPKDGKTVYVSRWATVE